jgi:hypothetical protein
MRLPDPLGGYFEKIINVVKPDDILLRGEK